LVTTPPVRLEGPRVVLGRLTIGLAAAFLLSAAIFSVWPGLDLWVSARFHDGQDFVDADPLEAIRNLIWSASILTALGAVGLWSVWLALGRQAEVPARLWGWVAAVYFLGPGLLVNGLLKEQWGRARPAQTFAGEAEFTAPFLITDQCDSNCSFVSGEASAAAALAIVLGTLLWPLLRGRTRRRCIALLALIAIVAAAMRVATGRHFLSDVLFAGFFTAFVALGLWWALQVAPARERLSIAALRADARRLADRASVLWRRRAG
jgi:lipid A 4'-phosphatase